jgi:hypothetical protein
MTCLWLSGFETGTVAGEGEAAANSVLTNFSYSTTVVRSGLRAGVFTGTGYSFAPASGGSFDVQSGFLRTYLYLDSTSVGAASRIMGFGTSLGHLASVRLRTDRKLELILNGYPAAMTTLAVSPWALAANTWYCLELHVDVPGLRLASRLDGTTWMTALVSSFAHANPIAYIWLGPDEATTSGCNLYYDDARFNSGAGSHNCSWPGPIAGGTVLLVPAASGGASPSWVAQAGGTAYHEQLDDLPALNIDTTTYMKETAGSFGSLFDVRFLAPPSMRGLVSAALVGVRGGGTDVTNRSTATFLADPNHTFWQGQTVNWALNGWKTVYPVLTVEEAWDGNPRPLTTDYLFGNSFLSYGGVPWDQSTLGGYGAPGGNVLRTRREDANALEIRITAYWMSLEVSIPYGPQSRWNNPAPVIYVDLDLP